MTFQEIREMIEEVGLPFAYYQFNEEKATAPPFICFFYGANNDLFADDTNFQTITTLNVELYTEGKDFEKETGLEAILKGHGLTFRKEETFLDSEKMHETIYHSEVVING